MGLRVTLLILAVIFVALVVMGTRRNGRMPAWRAWSWGGRRGKPKKRSYADAPSLNIEHEEVDAEEDPESPMPSLAEARDFNREVGTGRSAGNVGRLCGLLRREAPAGPDELMQFLVTLNGGKPLERKVLAKELPPMMSEFEGRAKCFGQSVFGHTWHDVMTDDSLDKFANLAFCLPLAGADGAGKASQFARLVDLAYQFSEEWGRKAHVPLDLDMAEKRAAEVEDFYNSYKVILYLHVVTRNDTLFSGRDIGEIFQRQRLTFDNGLYHKTGTDDEIIYSVADLYSPGSFDQRGMKRHQTGGLTVFMSLPLTSRPSASFAQMLQMTDALASGLGGDVFDPDFTPLSIRMVEQTSEEIAGVEEAMREFGIAAGSDSALRLFGE